MHYFYALVSQEQDFTASFKGSVQSYSGAENLLLGNSDVSLTM